MIAYSSLPTAAIFLFLMPSVPASATPDLLERSGDFLDSDVSNAARFEVFDGTARDFL